jgi:hypothetical protein
MTRMSQGGHEWGGARTARAKKATMSRDRPLLEEWDEPRQEGLEGWMGRDVSSQESDDEPG